MYMLSENIGKALNDQLNREFFSSYYYLSMAAYFLAQNLKGFSHWMRIQAQEETIHALKIYDFIDDRDGEIDLNAIDTPPKIWDTPLDVFQDALKHEQKISNHIYELTDLSLQEKDHATNTFLQWFIAEQVEEEATAKEMIDPLKLIGNDGNGLFLLDRDLVQRTLPVSEAGADPAGDV